MATVEDKIAALKQTILKQSMQIQRQQQTLVILSNQLSDALRDLKRLEQMVQELQEQS